MKPTRTAVEPDKLYWSELKDREWKLVMAASETGLCFVGSAGKGFEELEAWASARMPGTGLVRDDAVLLPYFREMEEYLLGKRRMFSLPLDMRGTSFQQKVWKALQELPYGGTASYTDIALHIKRPSSARAVGAAIGANPLLMVVPCHRVIGKNGGLTGFRGGLPMKKKLLDLESQSVVPEGAHADI